MKPSFRHLAPLLAIFSLSFLPAVAQGGPGNGGGSGGGNGLLQSYLQSLPLQRVDAVERLDLVYMRQEEKLARDVYAALAGVWPVPAFANIAASEQSHMDLVLQMLTRYGIPDPLPSDRPGEYGSPFFDALYPMLVGFGSLSQLHAEYVGLLIEDLDIVDLQTTLRRTDNRDIGTVYQNLMRGSRNHLRAFASLVARRGFTYTGTFLSAAEVAAILASPMENVPVDENGVPLR